ncbi:bacterial membrane protein YfhO [Lentilactobacillus sunkii]|uniref:Bacterial membrane protein YfhO n=1 Tax=Lentilactobacillus sunkii TaxID=481719 RepID=A0A1E7XHE4_9LACO|nr:YfhO family protein [Lentilactobacillus sunkii]OFA12524.1 bacterial membrane protein YfhO [Lentilactobacillus sunkii]
MEPRIDSRKKSYKLRSYIIYSIAFAIVCLATYTIPWLAGKTLIWNIDGIAQHFPILAQFQRILQGTAHQSLTGWSWNLGAGADQLTTFAFYVVGDPFSYLIALFPASKLELGFQLLILVRLYCVGLSFLAWANELHLSTHSRLIGTIIYTFSGYNFYVSMHHPFFILPMILFPLLAMGIEKVLHRGSWLPLAIAVSLALISNFYFAYMLAIGSLVYLVTRWVSIRHKHPDQIQPVKTLYCLAQAIFSGLLTASVVLLPTILTVLQSTRIAYHAKFANGLLLYPIKYYLSLPDQIITSTTTKDYWLVLNFCGLTFLAAVYILKHFKKFRALAFIITLTIVALLFPQFSAIANAMSTPSNRWLFLIVLPMCLATMIFVDELPKLTRSDITWLIVASFSLIVLVWITKGFTLNIPQNDLISYGILLSFLLLIVCQTTLKISPKHTGWILTGMILISTISAGQGWFSPNSSRNIKSNLVTGTATEWLKKYYDGAQEALPKHGDFYRTSTISNYYSHKTAGNNIPMVLGTHDLGAYYSIQNGNVFKFTRSLGDARAVVNSVIGEGDGRTTLLNLLGVKYIFAKTDILKNPQTIPYGFHFVRNQAGNILDYPEQPVSGLSNHSGTILLKSDLSLPLAYTQVHVLSDVNYNNMSKLQREQALLKGAVVSKPVDGVSLTQPSNPVEPVSYTTQVFDQHIVDTPMKAILDRMRISPNGRYRQAAKDFKTRIPANKVNVWRKATGIHPNSKPLQNVLAKNVKVIEQNKAENANGLHLMDNDAQGRHLSYKLNIDNPEKYKNSELYLVINGVSRTRHTTMDRLNTLTADSIIDGQPVSKLQKINRFRKALQYPDLGAYTLWAQSTDSFNFIRQLPINNLSDYEDRQHIVLNLGYSSKVRRAFTIHFKGVKQLRFKSVKLMAVPFNKNYDKQIHSLQKAGLTNQKVTHNSVSGYTDAIERTRVLTTSIPYSSGWHLKIDGQPGDVFKVNKGFVGARIPVGRHFIKLTYETPGLSWGIKLSIIGLAWMAIFALFEFGRFVYRKFGRKH